MLIVKKFGGTSVGNKERIFNVARRCIEDYQKGNDIVVVYLPWASPPTTSLRWREISIRNHPKERWIC